MKKILYIISAVMLAGVIAGCTGNFEDYNRNPKQPSSIPTSNLLQNTLQNISFWDQTPAQRMYTFFGAYSGQFTATANWGRGINNWAYYNPISDHKEYPMTCLLNLIYPSFFFIEDETDREGAIYGVALILKVYAMHMLASAQGPIPYSKIANGQIEAPYDDEATAWAAMFDDLDLAIDILNVSGSSNADLTTIDVVYNGDLTKWLKFAHTLKLRMAMRVSSVASYAQQKAEEAVAAGVMTDTSDSAWVNLEKHGLKNPWSISWLGQTGKTVEAHPNACLVSWMNGYNDPRRPKYFTQTSSGTYIGALSGSSTPPTDADYNNVSYIFYESDFAPMAVIYAAEAAFLRAEGALKGWNMGGTAEDFYHEGIRLSLREFDVESAYDSYIATTSAPAAHNDPTHPSDNVSATTNISVQWESTAERQLEQILTQKWIALYQDPMNGWADYRRTGYPKLWKATLSANPDVSTTRGARRTPFPESEYNNNRANVEAAAALVGGDSMGYDLWWAQKN